MPRVRLTLALGLPDPDRLSTTLLWSLLGHVGLLIGVLIYQNLPSQAPLRNAPYFVRLAAPAGSPSLGRVATETAAVQPIVPIEKPAPRKPTPSKSTLPPEAAKTHSSSPVQVPADKDAGAAEKHRAAADGSGGPESQVPPGPTPVGIGGTSFGEGDFQYDWYRSALEVKLGSQWRRPISTSPETQAASVSFTIRRDGTVLDVAIASPSGNPVLDLSVVRAVYDAAPLPPLPKSWHSESVHVTMEFQLMPGAP